MTPLVKLKPNWNFFLKNRITFNKMKKIFILVTAIILATTPVIGARVAYAANPIVPDCNTGELTLKLDEKGQQMIDSKGDKTGEMTFKNPCDFDYVITLINNIITFLLFYLAGPLAAIAICYAGGQLIFSGGSSEKITKAKKIIKNVVVGYIIALAAWLIIKTIFTTLGFKGETFLH